MVTFLYMFFMPNLPVKAGFSCVCFLGIDVKGFVFNVVIPFFIFPMHIFGLINFANAGFKDHCIVNARYTLRLKDVLKLDAAVRKVSNHRKLIFLLRPFPLCPFINYWKLAGRTFLFSCHKLVFSNTWVKIEKIFTPVIRIIHIICFRGIPTMLITGKKSYYYGR